MNSAQIDKVNSDEVLIFVAKSKNHNKIDDE